MNIPDAFSDTDYEAALNQSAFMLGTALVVAGYADRLPESGFLGVNRFALAEKECSELDDVIRSHLGVDPAAVHVHAPDSSLLADHGRRLALRVQREADPDHALALMAAGTNSEHAVVRASAATAASMICGRHPMLTEVLAAATTTDDPLAVDIAATGLGHIAPDHVALDAFIHDDPLSGPRRSPTNTLFMTHGTWARARTWWQPGGDFHAYLQREPALHVHDRSFEWSGSYRHGRREVAAIQLVAWIEQQGLDTPDIAAHSHGGTVANLSTHDEYGAQSYARMILLSWPVHRGWFPDFERVEAIVSIRVHFDLVIMADRGGQLVRPPAEHTYKVTERVRGWFNHSATHDPAYWDEHEIVDLITQRTP